MTRILTAADRNQLITEYREGKALKSILQWCPVSLTQFYRVIRNAGLDPRSNQLILPEAEIIAAYLAGESEMALAQKYGVSRRAISRRLLANGITRRTISEANQQRMAELTEAERKALTQKANRARRGTPMRPESHQRRAITDQKSMCYATADERQMAHWLESAGLLVTPQLAVGAYNIDVAIHAPAIAVELRSRNEFPSNHWKRSEYLFNHGWAICYAFVSARDYPLTKAAADNIVTWAEELRSHPSSVRQHRVIRGDGKTHTSLSRKFEHRA